MLYELRRKAILREVGYVGAGTCEFLIGRDGTVSFLEVNTRLQVEHPVSEEVTGIDLVREQFRIAEGGTLDYRRPGAARPLDRVPHQRRGPGPQLPAAPGPVHGPRACPAVPASALDSGVTTGDVISGAFDSLLAKLIVTGSSREDALERARRALDEFEVAGLPTGAARSTARSCATPRSPPRGRSASTPAGSRPSSTNDIEPWGGVARRADGTAREAPRRVVVEVERQARRGVACRPQLLPLGRVAGARRRAAPAAAAGAAVATAHGRRREGAHAGHRS